ncbi:Autophagy-related protein 18h [Platanthera guangdongensis]|uniref:Autophagy-related protein 18h n=1 Tax=Platanthera guangdongensis TaxID=2320717 RepID=A0ABR2MX45_9ASPA
MQVTIKDFSSEEVISQFRAHSCPDIALCFDPSCTMLVTTSVNGHYLNVLRIIPTCMPNDSNFTNYDWTFSQVLNLEQENTNLAQKSAHRLATRGTRLKRSDRTNTRKDVSLVRTPASPHK